MGFFFSLFPIVKWPFQNRFSFLQERCIFGWLFSYLWIYGVKFAFFYSIEANRFFWTRIFLNNVSCTLDFDPLSLSLSPPHPSPIFFQASRKHYCTNKHIRGKDNIDEEWCLFELKNGVCVGSEEWQIVMRGSNLKSHE